MRIIVLLFAIVVSGCTGDRLKAETRPNAVVLRAPAVAAAFDLSFFRQLDHVDGRCITAFPE
jgi:hypothetical protein